MPAVPGLLDPCLFRQLAYLDGKWVHGEGAQRDLAVTDPATLEVLGHVPMLSASQVDAAIAAADRAFATWRELGIDRRTALLERWHRLILEHREDLARLITLEQGKPLNDARGEVDYAASFVKWFAEEGRRAYGETIPSHIHGASLATVKEPVGVAALITPWNFPLAMITRKAAAALAAGCTVVVKPANETPFIALALAELAERAELPSGTFNVVTGDAPMVAGRLCSDPRVMALSFTGSTRVGRLLLAQCADSVKRVSLELGGNAPFIVCADIDPELAAEAAVEAKFQTSGQDCLAANRIFVHRSIYEPFIERFVERMLKLELGNGFDRVELGPLIHRRAVEQAEALVEDAVTRGARLYGGDQTRAPGPNFFVPALLADVTPAMRVFREESFDPVAAVCAYDDEETLLRDANDTEYGLAAYVYGRDLARVRRLVRGLRFGMVSVNSVKMTGPPVPFGGVKQSGLGREGGRAGLEEYLATKYVCISDPPGEGRSAANRDSTGEL
ncbi:NAD-dependent succinate-semialdehyde dehydrogenase [Halotalea alkalilenta]|uniref:NAD-dependent succinate-semialdehyde dehydrogenase n=1 Tax=Halotalea alkalilenta TaxID=376489 RepID=UPI0006943E4E|nr:NAD-dependent succinate-semialdehyde dehydrogenase [Halotalea alkalilenta]